MDDWNLFLVPPKVGRQVRDPSKCILNTVLMCCRDRSAGLFITPIVQPRDRMPCTKNLHQGTYTFPTRAWWPSWSWWPVCPSCARWVLNRQGKTPCRYTVYGRFLKTPSKPSVDDDGGVALDGCLFCLEHMNCILYWHQDHGRYRHRIYRCGNQPTLEPLYKKRFSVGTSIQSGTSAAREVERCGVSSFRDIT